MSILDDIKACFRNIFGSRKHKRDPLSGVRVDPINGVHELSTLQQPLKGPILGSSIQYILNGTNKSFASVIPADKFQVWMAELERVLSYYLFDGDRPTRTPIRLSFRDYNGVAYTHDYMGGKQIVLSTSYLNKIVANRNTAYMELSGVVIHEMVHCFQNNGGGKAPLPLIEGIADYIRLRGGVPSPSWRRSLSGGPMAGYSATAYFLEYIDSIKPGFVKRINRLMAQPWSNDYWSQASGGQSMNDLWNLYVQKYR